MQAKLHSQSSSHRPFVSIPGPYVGTIASEDGLHVAFVMTRDGKQLVAVGGRFGPEYDATGDIVFSPEFENLVHAAEQGIAMPS